VLRLENLGQNHCHNWVVLVIIVLVWPYFAALASGVHKAPSEVVFSALNALYGISACGRGQEHQGQLARMKVSYGQVVLGQQI